MSTTHDEGHDDERDDEHDGPEEGDDDDSREELPQVQVRRRTRRTTASAAPVLPLSPFGAIPERATHFGLRKRGPSGVYEVVETPSEDGSILLREWPLADLDAESIRAKHGPGDYRLTWIGTSTRGGRAAIGKSRDFRIPPAVAPVAAAPPVNAAGPALPPELQSTFTLMNLLEQQSTAKLAQLAQMAALFTGGAQRGPDPNVSAMVEMMRETMREQREASERQTQLILRALEGDDDDGDDEPEARTSTNPAPPVFKPGEPISEAVKSTFLNWAVSNPEQAIGIAKEALSVVGKLANVATNAGPVAAPARAPARAVQVTRREPPALEQAPPPSAESNGAPVSANAAYVAAAATQAPPAS